MTSSKSEKYHFSSGSFSILDAFWVPITIASEPS